MRTLILVFQLLPAIIDAVRALEAAIPLSGKGKEKLDIVLDTVREVYSTSRDLQKDLSLDALLHVVCVVVGKIVGMFNALGVFDTSK